MKEELVLVFTNVDHKCTAASDLEPQQHTPDITQWLLSTLTLLTPPPAVSAMNNDTHDESYMLHQLHGTVCHHSFNNYLTLRLLSKT